MPIAIRKKSQKRTKKADKKMHIHVGVFTSWQKRTKLAERNTHTHIDCEQQKTAEKRTKTADKKMHTNLGVFLPISTRKSRREESEDGGQEDAHAGERLY